MNVAEPLFRQAERTPDKVALVAGGRSISFHDLVGYSNALAHRFRARGLKPGDIVLVLLPVGIPLYATAVALFCLGVAVLFPDPSTGILGLKRCVRSLPVRGFVGNWKARLARAFLPFLRRIPITLSTQAGGGISSAACEDLEAEAPALVTFTSGSTGQPKGIMRSHGFLMRQHDLVRDVLRPQEGDVDLISLPIFVLANLGSGVTSIIPKGDLQRPASLEGGLLLHQIEQYGVTRILAPPALCELLCDTGESVPQLTRVFTGGGPVFPDLLRRLKAFAPNAEVVAIYGSTEAEPIAHISCSQIDEEDFAAMARGEGLLAGRPVDAVQIRLVEDEILVTGHHVVKGYIDPKDDDTTKVTIGEDIWHRTGDAGRLDEDGRLWLLGRIGENDDGIYPFAIETAARSISGVRNAAFTVQAEKPTLVVEARRAADPSEIRGRLMERFPHMSLVFLAEIPMDRRHNSKVDRPRLERLLSDTN